MCAFAWSVAAVDDALYKVALGQIDEFADSVLNLDVLIAKGSALASEFVLFITVECPIFFTVERHAID